MNKNNTKTPIYLGEGNTPLIRFCNLEQSLSWSGELWAKAEYQNPTGSFKDRGSIVEITAAIKQKKKGVVCASTGNMAASLSAYAAKAGLPCIVIVPNTTPLTKLKQALAFGGKLIKVNGNYDKCVAKAEKIAKQKNYLLCGDYQLRRLGQSTIGLELAQCKQKFDAFIVPVGNGTVGCAITEGLAEYGQLPMFIGIQGKGSDPIYLAWKNKKVIKFIKQPQTIASAMKVGQPLDGKTTLDWIVKTRGMMVSVSDKEIINSKNLLAKKEGILVETSAAATLAGLIQIKKQLNKNLKIVLILTGNGLKERG